MSATRLLTRGWRRGSMKWYVGTAAVLASAITLLLLVAGLFAGMQAETQDRVADFYTEDVRITVRGGGAIPPSNFDDPQAAADLLTKGKDVAIMHLEAQSILSRRGFVEAALFEDESFQVDTPGSDANGDEVIALGAVIGVDMRNQRDRAPIAEHLVVGAMPKPGTGEGSVPLVMSLDRLDGFLTSAERAEMTWPPTLEEVQPISFEITSAVVKEQGQDVIRRPAHIVGLYDSGVDILDAFTLVAPIEHVRTLLGHNGTDDVVNAILVSSKDPLAVHEAASDQHWSHQSAAHFTDRYLGQLIRVLQAMSLLMTGFLFLLPAFLVTHGVTRQLETHNREIAVCKAIGIRNRTVRLALGGLVAQMTAVALLVAGVVTGLVGAVLHFTLPDQRGLPLPMDFQATATSIALALLVTIGSVAISLMIAFRSHRKQGLASTLRTF